METRKNIDLSAIRSRLKTAQGPEYWRSLDQLAQTEEFAAMVQREFPEQAAELKDPVSRRNFLKLMSASLALGGLSGCTIQPREKIVPQVRAPENVIPGKPQYFASAASLGGIGTGILVESHQGRPTKIEGNPEHPSGSRGSNALVQASILDLYDPDRSQTVKNAGRISTWNIFLADLTQRLSLHEGNGGTGLRLLTQTVTSPTLGHQLQALRAKFPQAQWHQYEPVNRDNARAGAQMAFGQPVHAFYDLANAKVILSLDADFTYSTPGNVRHARDLAAGHRFRNNAQASNRLYAVESSPTATGSLADHRLALGTAHIEALALKVAHGLGIGWEGPSVPADFSAHDAWIAALVDDLKAHRGQSLVLAGDQQAPAVHALAYAINHALGNAGTTVHYTDPLEVESVDQRESLAALVADMNAGQVESLFILGGNPVYDAPVDLDLAAALDKVGYRVHLGLYEDETSELCHWHIPESHFLEAWSDTRAHDGLATIVQPLIRPLYKTKSAHDCLAVLTGQPGVPDLEIVRQYWADQGLDAAAWRRALHDGFVEGTRPQAQSAPLVPLRLPATTGDLPAEEDLEIHFRPDPMVWDGRFTNNAWLQETPKPITKLTWDNAVLVSPATAERLRLKSEFLAELRFDGRVLKAAVWIVPGQADGVATLHLGYGQKRSGRIGRDKGFNAYALRPTAALWSGGGLQISGSYDPYRLACTQDHHSMEGRNLVRQASLGYYQAHPHFAHEGTHDPPDDLTLHNRTDHQYTGYAWGMVIDLGSCIGCNACAVACQAENNIPIVGKDEVLNGREMPWIRVDRYYQGALDNPEIAHQPVPCMQCENAPCELVCPVAATTHSDEGLNDMVYNRCVGTRYCANNCPYKVRRFNFLQYADRETESLKLQRNPDVTTRARGVMEKCTYCVQRINQARIEAKKANLTIGDGEIVTACEQACPTESIVFGDINDPQSRVSALKASPLNYGILTELNTRPRTTYLASIKNPNPKIAEA